MNLELFLKYCFSKYIKEHGDADYFKYVNVSLNNLYIFKTKYSKTNDISGEDLPEINLLNEYHFGILDESISNIINGIYRGETEIGNWDTYKSLLQGSKEFIENRPSIIKEKVKNGIISNDDSKYFSFSIEMSDVLYMKLRKEIGIVALKVESTDYDKMYEEIKKSEGIYMVTFILEHFLNIENYMEKMSANHADLVVFLTEDKMANYLSYTEYVINMSRNLKSEYNKDTNLINSNISLHRYQRAYTVLITFLALYPTTVTNRNLITINSGLNINKIKTVFMNILVSPNLESHVSYIFNTYFSYIYDESNDTTNIILRYLHAIILCKPNQFDTLDLLNDIKTKDFSLKTKSIFKDSSYREIHDQPKAIAEFYNSIITRDIGPETIFNECLYLSMKSAMDIYEAVSENGETAQTYFSAKDAEIIKNGSSNATGKAYEVKYKLKKFVADAKHRRYEKLLNEISKDLYLANSNATELITPSEKSRLIREIHSVKSEMITIKNKAKAMNDETLIELIEEREEFADEVLENIQKRNIRQERKGTSFKLETDMTQQLRRMNRDEDLYEDEDDM